LQLCSKKFRWDHDRKVHEREQHNTTEEFPCRVQLNNDYWGCDRVFPRKTSLIRHLKSNTGRNCRPQNVSDALPLQDDTLHGDGPGFTQPATHGIDDSEHVQFEGQIDSETNLQHQDLRDQDLRDRNLQDQDLQPGLFPKNPNLCGIDTGIYWAEKRVEGQQTPDMAFDCLTFGGNHAAGENVARLQQVCQSLPSTWDMIQVPRANLNPPPYVYGSELVLRQIRDYFPRRLTMEEPLHLEGRPPANTPSRHQEGQIERNEYEFVGMVTHAIDQLSQGRRGESWTLLREACDMVPTVLKQQGQDLLRLLLLLFCDQRWSILLELRLSVLKHLTEMARQGLGTQHPLTVIFRFLQIEGILSNTAELSLRLMLDILCDQTRSMDNGICRFKRGLVDLLRIQGKFHAAAEICRAMALDNITRHGHYHQRTRGTLRRLGRIYYEQGWYDEAESIFMQVLALGEIDHGVDAPDICDIYASDRLASQPHNLTTSQPLNLWVIPTPRMRCGADVLCGRK
jgi:hypothetical protein